MNDPTSGGPEHDVIFGPVPSRRLGMSLGVDVVPMKVCSYDCVYCELGQTTRLTLERKPYVPERTVIRALERYFATHETGTLDYVTFSGSGEPTLNSGIGTLIRTLKTLTDTPVAVLTNGSLLHDPDVRRDLMAADLVVPSLDAVLQDRFVAVNRPAAGLDVSDVEEGLYRFSRDFAGEIWLEILLVEGVNDQPDHLRALAESVRRIDPTKVQLSTVVRPPGHGTAPAVDGERMFEIAGLFDGNVEVVTNVERRGNPAYREDRRDRIEATLKIRPMTVEEIARTTGMHRNEVVKYLDQLRVEERLQDVEHGGNRYYSIVRARGAD